MCGGVTTGAALETSAGGVTTATGGTSGVGEAAGELTAGTGTGTGTGMTAAGGLAAARETKRAKPRGIEVWYLMMCGWEIPVEEKKHTKIG